MTPQPSVISGDFGVFYEGEASMNDSAPPPRGRSCFISGTASRRVTAFLWTAGTARGGVFKALRVNNWCNLVLINQRAGLATFWAAQPDASYSHLRQPFKARRVWEREVA
eukprot:3096851-Prymnesium_polylepis.1